MRVTGTRMIDLSAAATGANQAKVATTSHQVSSGLRLERPSDDPAAWLAAERAKLRREVVAGSTKAVELSRDRLTQVESSLATIGDLVSQVRALAVQGASSTYNANDRVGLATQVRTMMTTAVGAANVRAPTGEYLLAGTESLAEPFAADGSYLGNATARQIKTTTDTLLQTSISGADLTTNTPGGVDVLPLFEQVAAALSANDPNAVAGLLQDLQTAIDQVGRARTHIGGEMSVLDATTTAHRELTDSLNETISNELEIDTIDAASALAKTSQALETSRVISSHLIGLLDPRLG